MKGMRPCGAASEQWLNENEEAPVDWHYLPCSHYELAVMNRSARQRRAKRQLALMSRQSTGPLCHTLNLVSSCKLFVRVVGPHQR